MEKIDRLICQLTIFIIIKDYTTSGSDVSSLSRQKLLDNHNSRGVPTYTTYLYPTQIRTKTIQNKKKYMIVLRKQNKIIQMSNVWSEEFNKKNKKKNVWVRL